MTRMRSSCLLLVVTCTAVLCACGARTPLSIEADAAAPDGGSAQDAAVEGGAFHLGAPAVVLDGVDEGVDLQRFGQLVWTGDKFAVVWLENRDGHIFVVMRFISAAGVVEPGKYIISDDYTDVAQSPQSTWLLWTGTGFVAFWTVEHAIMTRRVSAQGALTSAQIPAWGNLGAHAYLKSGVRWMDLNVLLGIDDQAKQYDYQPFIVRVSDEGLPGPSHGSMADESFESAGGLVLHDLGYAMLWTRRFATGPDHVYLNHLYTDGSIAALGELYSSEDALLSVDGPTLAASHDALYATVWDLKRGVIVQRISEETDELALAKDATGAGVIGVASDETVGLLYGRGAWQSTNPLPVEVAFALVDDSGVKTGPFTVNTAPAGGGCVEAYTIASTGDGFGLLWAEGCAAARTVYFVRVGK